MVKVERLLESEGGRTATTLGEKQLLESGGGRTATELGEELLLESERWEKSHKVKGRTAAGK